MNTGCTFLGRHVPGGGCLCAFFLILFLCLILPPQTLAIEASNVLVLYNVDNADGLQIANYYQQTHPGVHLLGLNGINGVLTGSTSEGINAADYLSVIRPQVSMGIGNITDSIDVIVTTKGLPLRIDAGTDPGGFQNWRRYSSLESELTRIDSIDMVNKMGDQFILTGFPQWDTNLASNPYYDTNSAFVRVGSDPVNGDIRLSARLDGYSVQAVKDSIDRAQKVFAVPHARGTYVIADDDPTAGIDQMTDGAGPGSGLVTVLDAHNQAYEYENTDDAITDLIDPGTDLEKGSAIGYVSHGTNDGAGGLEPGYIQNQLDFDLADGAVFLTHESFNAKSFDPLFSQSQGLIAEWIARGGTAGLGHVEEPLNGPDNVTNEDMLFDMLLPADGAMPGESGLTFVEAAWNATRQLSYVNTVVGDPLMIWRSWLPGDANLDGFVNLDDLAILQIHWLGQGDFREGDFNGDGWINLDDLAVLQVHWLDSVWEQGEVPISIPEPQTMFLLVLMVLPVIRVSRRSIL